MERPDGDVMLSSCNKHRPPVGYTLPPNVKLIDLGARGITKLYSKIVPETKHSQLLSKQLSKTMREMPWMLIQFKVSHKVL